MGVEFDLVTDDKACNGLDVVALGELLIHFTPHGYLRAGAAASERNPGGAPANVLAALAKLGRSTAFIGAVGEDAFGHYLRTCWCKPVFK